VLCDDYWGRKMEKKIISINELSGEEILGIIQTAIDIKKNPDKYRQRLRNKILLLLFQKTSTRTRIAFELGMKKLGGMTIVMDWAQSNFTISPLKYEARYVGIMVDVILARLLKNEDIVELACTTSVPVINGCCNLFHPSQVLADLMTVYETKGGFDTTLAYVGVQNNVANSLFYACSKVRLPLIFVTPIKDTVPDDFTSIARDSQIFKETLDLEYAASNAEFLYTDTWINMEEFNQRKSDPKQEKKINKMLAYQINRSLIQDKDVYVLHDMPVHPGLEIDDYSITFKKSLIFVQAENRMYSGQALLLHLLNAV
jgi:ornithine carbamoyltransferase